MTMTIFLFFYNLLAFIIHSKHVINNNHGHYLTYSRNKITRKKKMYLRDKRNPHIDIQICKTTEIQTE